MTTLPTLPTLPTLAPPTHDEWSVTMPLGQFRRAVNAMTFAVSRDQSRPILTGLLFDPEDGELNVVATDSFRLVRASLRRHLTFEGKPAAAGQSIIPAVAVRDFLKVVSQRMDNGSGVTLTFETPDHIRVDLRVHDGTTYSARLPRVGGAYPNYRTLMDSTDGPVTEDVTPGFNLAYVNYFYKMAVALGAVKATTGETSYPVRMENHGALKPARLWINADDDILLTCMIMPIRVP